MDCRQEFSEASKDTGEMVKRDRLHFFTIMIPQKDRAGIGARHLHEPTVARVACCDHEIARHSWISKEGDSVAKVENGTGTFKAADEGEQIGSP